MAEDVKKDACLQAFRRLEETALRYANAAAKKAIGPGPTEDTLLTDGAFSLAREALMHAACEYVDLMDRKPKGRA